MGACVSTSNQSSQSRRSIREPVVPHLATDFSGQKRSQRKLVEQQVSNLLQHLPSVPGRIIGNGKSKSSCIFTQQGCKGINQDAMIVWEDFMGEDVTFCGVFDGHGPHGHLVAHQVRDDLPVRLLSTLHSYKSQKDEPGVTCFRRGSKKTDRVKSADDSILEDKSSLLWRQIFLKLYKSMDKELRSHPNLDCFCSGSTAVTLVKQGCDLFLAYIGDSRAILGSKDSNDAMEAIQLTVDLKPSLPKEAERIKRCKGRVFALQDEPEVARVWLPFDDAPGLAMARAFGDFCLKQYGVISIPEFAHRTLTERDQFIVLASDGIWDVLSNQEVVDIVASAPTRASAARLLVDSAAGQWKRKYPTSKMDDCAVVCLFLDGIMDSEPNYIEQDIFSSIVNSILSENSVGSRDGNVIEPILQRNTTVRSAEDNKAYGKQNAGYEVDDNQHWTGLEGVTRVNSLVQLPRFSNDRIDL